MTEQLSFPCDNCGVKLKAPISKVGKTFSCPKCDAPVTVFDSRPVAVAPPEIPRTRTGDHAFNPLPETESNKKAHWLRYVILGACGAVLLPVIGCIGLVSFIAAMPLDQPVVTLEEYSRIHEGMTYEEVVAIIGEEGEELSRVNVSGFTTVMYGWTNPSGANMNAMFQNGLLVSKAQFGLE